MARRKTISTKCTITCRPGRDISDDGWEIFQPADIAIWKEACTSFASKAYQHEQWDIAINVDWRPVVRRLQHNHNISRIGFSKPRAAEGAKAWERYRHGPVSVPCTVVAKPIRKKSTDYFHPDSYVANFAYDVFLGLNLALPGSCGFYKSAVDSGAMRNSREIDLSHYWFELSYLNGQEKKEWPTPKQLPLPTVCNWLQQVRVGLTQVPNSQMEKVLFALWHICVSDVSPNTVIWLFHALETLFDTKAGENFRALHQRIGTLLSVTEDEERILKKQLRILYDLRSSFVHGGLEVIHPLHNEMLDKRVDSKYWRVATACEFGFAVLLRSIQEVIARNLSAVRYKEQLSTE